MSNLTQSNKTVLALIVNIQGRETPTHLALSLCPVTEAQTGCQEPVIKILCLPSTRSSGVLKEVSSRVIAPDSSVVLHQSAIMKD